MLEGGYWCVVLCEFLFNMLWKSDGNIDLNAPGKICDAYVHVFMVPRGYHCK